jgi:AraC-like DNA-binding protein
MPYSRQVTEFSLAVLCSYARANLIEPLVVTAVHLPHPKPADTAAHERIFRSHVRFDQSAAAMHFESRFLRVPLRSADSKLATLLEPHAKAELEKLDDSQRGVVDALRPALVRALRCAGTPSLEEMARQLAVSPRTLQRQLSEAGTSFRQLLGEAQSAWAADLLLEPSLGTAEVAALLGFSETAAFHRSFKRWTGLTPHQHRLRNRRASQ